MDIERMLQLALGVPDAIPAGRRQRMAAWKLAELTLAEEQLAELDVESLTSDPYRVLEAVAKVYREVGALDPMVAGVKWKPLRRGEVQLVLESVVRTADSKHWRCEALAIAALDELARWSRANPRLDDL
jgi:hypothetical protein